MAHSMNLKNRIFCVVGISIFRFKKYWQTVFNLMELNMSPTFKPKQSTPKKNKSYYQLYDVKNEILPQAVNDETANIREHTCKVKWDGLHSRNTLLNKSCQNGQSKITNHDQSTGKEAKKRFQCGSINHFQVTSKDCPVGLATRK